jgi:hypothetical protein
MQLEYESPPHPDKASQIMSNITVSMTYVTYIIDHVGIFKLSASKCLEAFLGFNVLCCALNSTFLDQVPSVCSFVLELYVVMDDIIPKVS